MAFGEKRLSPIKGSELIAYLRKGHHISSWHPGGPQMLWMELIASYGVRGGRREQTSSQVEKKGNDCVL